MKYYIYKFVDELDSVLYIGKTKQLEKRINNHIIQKEWIKNGIKVFAGECQNKTDMDMYEIYYINKLNPLHNIASVNNEGFTIDLPELNFLLYKELTDINTINKPKELNYNDYINSPLIYMDGTLSYNGINSLVLNRKINKLLYKHFYHNEYIIGYNFRFNDCGLPIIGFDFLFIDGRYCYIILHCEWDQLFNINENFYCKALAETVYKSYLNKNRNDKTIIELYFKE